MNEHVYVGVCLHLFAFNVSHTKCKRDKIEFQGTHLSTASIKLHCRCSVATTAADAVGVAAHRNAVCCVGEGRKRTEARYVTSNMLREF